MDNDYLDKIAKSEQIRRTATRRIKAMTPRAARDILDDLVAITSVNDSARSTVKRIITRALTGGYWSQSLDGHVFRELGNRELGL